MTGNRERRGKPKVPAKAGAVAEQTDRRAWRDAVLYVLLISATAIAYLPAMRGNLLWDDNMHVTRQDLQSLHGLWRIWFDLGATQQYYPLLHSAFWFEHCLWGDSPIGYHLVNVLLHAASACLVVAIVRRLALPGAWLAGFLFALHPVCVEAVAWISEQKSTLSGVLYLSSALVYLKFDRTRKTSYYALALLLFILALLSKTVTATLPAVLLVLFWWQRGRLDLRRDIAPLVPWFAIAVPAGLFTAWVERTPGLIGAQGAAYSLTWLQRLLLAGRVPWFYAWKTLWPWSLLFVYPHWNIDPSIWWQYLYPLGLVAVLAAFLWLAAGPRQRRGPLASLAVFLGTLFPVLGFFNVYPFRYSFVADHFQYLALLAIVIPLGAGLAGFAACVRLRAPIVAMLLAILPAAFAAADWRQSGNYASYETLFRRTIESNPGSPFLRSNLGVILMSSGREQEAADEFAEAVRLSPGSVEYRVNLGLALAQLPGRMADAIDQYRSALRIDPHYPSAHLNLGLALTSIPGRMADAVVEYQAAISDYRRAAETGSDSWEAHFNLGLAYGQMPDRIADAVAELQTAVRMKPNSAMAHFHLGNSYQKMRRLPEAIAEYQTSLRISPDIPETHYELAYALAQIPGRLADAIAECREMLRLKQDDKPGQQLLNSLLAFRNGQAK